MIENAPRPSGAHLWSICPGSHQMQQGCPDDESDAAQEGTAAHEVALAVAQGLPAPAVASNGVTVTDEMVRGAHLYRSVIAEWGGEVHLEVPVQPLGMHSRLPRYIKGTPDAKGWKSGGGLLRMGDYKFGFRTVTAFENPQMVTYAAIELDNSGDTDLAQEVEFTIVQPRDFRSGSQIKRWLTPAWKLRGQINLIAAAAEEAMRPDARTVAGPHCIDCLARHRCDTLQQAGAEIADRAGAVVTMGLTPQQAGRELTILRRMKETLDARVNGLEAQVEAAIRTGASVSDWQLQSTASRLKWTAPAAQVAELGKLFGKDLAKPLEVITPTQAIDLGVQKEAVEAMAKRSPGGMKLAPADHSKAREIFT